MATIDDSIGKFLRGKLGKQFTVYERLGKTVVRSVPEGFRPTGEGQLAQQKRIKGCNTFYKAIKAAKLYVYWQRALKPAGWTGHHLFMHLNLPTFSGKGWIEAPEKVRMTIGTGLLLPDKVHLKRGEETKGAASDGILWEVTWENATDYPRCNANDRAVVVLMRGGKYYDVKFAKISDDAQRKTERLVFVQRKDLREYVHGYLFFQSANGEYVTDSMYMGVLE